MTNTVEAITATMLGNALRTVWKQLETSGSSTTAPEPALMDYGLVGEVVLSYLLVVIRVRR